MLGLDISSSAVKLIELSRSAGGYRVEACSVVSLPDNTVVEKKIIDIRGLADAIEKAVAYSGTKLSDAAVAVSDSLVITKYIELPQGLTDLQIQMEIEVVAYQYIPYPMEEVAFDFDILGPIDTDANVVRVLIVACRRDNIEHRRQALKMAGLTPKVVDVERFVVERAYQLMQPQLDAVRNLVVAIADIATSMITFTVLVDGKAVYSRDQLFGDKQFTDEIQGKFSLSYKEAGEVKRNRGLSNGYKKAIFGAFKESIIQHIDRSLQFFYSSMQYSSVDQLLLVGGCSALDGLLEQTQQSLGLPVTVIKPLDNMQINRSINPYSLDNDAPAMMLAVGLALRSFD
tara:strand:- start:3216 stop:4244 length:1029 start_codon:yes stop_codon:yes gene_type:complete